MTDRVVRDEGHVVESSGASHHFGFDGGAFGRDDKFEGTLAGFARVYSESRRFADLKNPAELGMVFFFVNSVTQCVPLSDPVP